MIYVLVSENCQLEIPAPYNGEPWDMGGDLWGHCPFGESSICLRGWGINSFWSLRLPEGMGI